MARKIRKTTEAPSQHWSPERLAADLGVSVRTLSRYVKAGKLTPQRARGLTYFTGEEVQRYRQTAAA
jgi:predicted site-specific integrase-resolvase